MGNPAGQCEIKVGLFLLRRCERASNSSCGKCQKPVCPEHLGPSFFCVECQRGALAAAPSLTTPKWVVPLPIGTDGWGNPSTADLTPEELAIFDQVAQADREGDRDALFDS